ncbi:hypothetical protein RJ640_001828, partial [Escallonia rubra]
RSYLSKQYSYLSIVNNKEIYARIIKQEVVDTLHNYGIHGQPMRDQLSQAFVIHGQIRQYLASNIRVAKSKIQVKEPGHPILLCRLGIQFFQLRLKRRHVYLFILSHLNLLSLVIENPILLPTQDILDSIYEQEKIVELQKVSKQKDLTIINIHVRKGKKYFFFVCNSYEAIGAYRHKRIHLDSPLWL